MDIILELFGLCCITILFVTGEPMVLIKRHLGFKEEFYYEWKPIKQFIFRLITCCLCSGFWIGLIYTQSIILASIISVVSEIINTQLKTNEL
jgi:hypothetical protein